MARGRMAYGHGWLLFLGAIIINAVAIAALLVATVPEEHSEPIRLTVAAFETLPPESDLPPATECALRVERAGLDREVRPGNEAANRSVPQRLSLPPWPDFWNPSANRLFVPRIDGGYTGTTDEIIAWGACKWGIDADLVRAMAVAESSWDQGYVGDQVMDPAMCVGDYTLPCPTSFGLLQLKHTTRPGSWPNSQLHTAFNVDYSLAVLRGCFEGLVTYLGEEYGPGDLWGCVGWHYSGEWKDAVADRYIQSVQGYLESKPWLTW